MRVRFKQLFTLVFVAVAFFFAGLNYREFTSPVIIDTNLSSILPTPKVISVITPKPKLLPPANFTGPELFSAINKKRISYGVNQLGRSDELCSIASFRLNQLLPSKTIDNHAGFIALSDDKNGPFNWIFDKYNIAEFLIFLPTGTANDAVEAWDDTLGHQKILRGGEFTLGCAYAQNGIGVALAGY